MARRASRLAAPFQPDYRTGDPCPSPWLSAPPPASRRALAEVLLDGRVHGRGRRTAEELLRELCDAHPGRAVAQAMDLLEPEAAVAGLEALVGRLGGMDLLVVSAGSVRGIPDSNSPRRPGGRGQRDRLRRPHGLRIPVHSPSTAGKLVGISSVAGVRGCPVVAVVRRLQGLRRQLPRSAARPGSPHRLPVVVTEIVPGFVDTPMIAGRADLFWVAGRGHRGAAGLPGPSAPGSRAPTSPGAGRWWRGCCGTCRTGSSSGSSSRPRRRPRALPWPLGHG